MTRYFAGLDLGSTSMKLLLVSDTGDELVHHIPTPWVSGAGGTTSIELTAVQAAVRGLVEQASEQLPQGSRVVALAAAGMGETGFLVTAEGPVAPGFAWFDPRGSDQVDAFPPQLREEFAGRTGLPWGVQVSAAKMLFLKDSGAWSRDAQWVNLPELAISVLGGELVSEYSLASRTGLLDQQTGRAWPELLDYLGVPETFLPRLVEAGTHLGYATAGWLPEAFRGAALTVAGHDHLVAAVSGGAERDAYHLSMGTAEVLLRALDNPLTFDARRRLADALINCVRHVVPGEFVLVAGVKSGLIMRRTLQLVGVTDRAGRDKLDREVTALKSSALPPDALEVSGARNDDGVLRLTVRADGLSPAELFRAVLEHSNDELELLIAAMDREVPPARATLVTGGWAEMDSVLELRSEVLPNIYTSTRVQETASGAVLFARRLIEALEELEGTESDARTEHH
ncbi:MAG: FGGY family carbohydrate kinase [Pseudomonadota bacterium]|nr:FGGY family carbohydrate kinase [Pseudomonadota bacterium]